MPAARIKILIVSLNFPFPVNNGGAIAQTFFLEKMQEEFEVHFASAVADEFHIDQFNKRYPSIKVHNLYDSSTEQRNSLFFNVKLSVSRSINKLRKKRGSTPTEDHLNLAYIRNLVSLKTDGFIRKLNTVFEEGKYDIVQYDFFETLDLGACLPENAASVFVSHELRSKRISLAAEHSRTSNAYQQYLSEITSMYEYALLRKFNRVLVFNEDDEQILAAAGVNASLSAYAIPSFMHIRKQPSTTFEKLLFIGGESHFPNKEGLAWLLETIYTTLPDTKYHLYIIGEWSPEFKLQYAGLNKIHFLGAQPEIYSHFDNAILVAPILSGAGLRTKILDAMVNYLPVFCTPFACEGIDLSNSDRQVLNLFSNKQEFSKLLTLKGDQLEATALAAKNFYDTYFSDEVLTSKRLDIYRSLIKKVVAN